MTFPLFDQQGSSEYPDSKAVADFHRNSDKDASAESLHHTLGKGRTQASQGDHIHDGESSVGLWDGLIFTEDLSTSLGLKNAVKKIIVAMAEKGATDNSII